MKAHVLLAALVVAALAHPSFADDAQWKRDMERKLEALTQRLDERNGGIATVAASSTGARGFAPAASGVYRTTSPNATTVGGWLEFTYQNFNTRRDNGAPSGRRDEADVTHAVLYVGHRFTDRLVADVGVDLEHGSTGGGATARGEVGLEFATLDYEFKPAIGLRAGLVLVPVGFLNEDHEPGSFHGVRRPSVETDILPSTWREEGVGVFGETAGFRYRAYVMNGLQGVRDNANGTGVTGFNALTPLRNGRARGGRALADDPAIAGRVDFVRVPGLLVGLSGYRGDAGQSVMQNGSEIDAPVTLWDAHAAYRHAAFELKGLYTKGWIGDVEQLNAANGLIGPTSIGQAFFGGYVEAACNVMPLFRTRGYLAPFVRWERLDTQESVPDGYFKNPANDRTEYTYGLTWKPHPQVVVKADYQDFRNDAGTAVNRLNLGFGVAF